MSIAGWGLESSFYLALPVREAGYLLLGSYLLIIGLSMRRPVLRLPRQLGRLFLVPAVLGLAALVLSGAFTVRFSTEGAAPEPNQSGAGPGFPLLGAAPWMIAAGFVGDFPAVLLGSLGGVVRGGWGTQRLLTPFGIAAQAALFSWLIRRPYSEWPGRMARRPLPSALATGLLFGLLRSAEDFVYAPGDFLGALRRAGY